MQTLHYYSVCMVPPLVPVLSHMNQAHILVTQFLILSFILCLGLSKHTFTWDFKLNYLYSIFCKTYMRENTVITYNFFPPLQGEYCRSGNEIDVYLAGKLCESLLGCQLCCMSLRFSSCLRVKARLVPWNTLRTAVVKTHRPSHVLSSAQVFQTLKQVVKNHIRLRNCVLTFVVNGTKLRRESPRTLRITAAPWVRGLPKYRILNFLWDFAGWITSTYIRRYSWLLLWDLGVTFANNYRWDPVLESRGAIVHVRC